MSTQAALDKDDPILIAWQAYKDTPEYANTKRWAGDPNHVDGSLWSAWLAGRAGASAPLTETAQTERNREAKLRAALQTFVALDDRDDLKDCYGEGDAWQSDELQRALIDARQALRDQS